MAIAWSYKKSRNEIVGVNVTNINDDDVWLWQLDSNGNYANEWKKVPSVTGNNIIYNSLSNSDRNIYAVISRDSDQIDLAFADGNFGNLPKGNFRLFYRQSNGLSYVIKPDQMRGIQITVPYLNKLGQSQQLTLTLSLQYTVSNSSAAETNDSIKLKAPQSYYTQNRMITAEDYNIAPLTEKTIHDRDQHPWFDDELSELKYHRDSAYKNFCRSNADIDHILYAELRRNYQNLLNSKMISYFKDKNAQDFKNSKKFWEFYSTHIKIKSDKSNCSYPSSIRNGTQTANSPTDIGNMFNFFFSSLSSQTNGDRNSKYN